MTDYLRVDRPVFAPSCCLLCTRSSDPEGFVDLGRDLNATHPDARVYVCSRCSSQLGAAFGMVAKQEADLLRGANTTLAAAVDQLDADLAEARDLRLVSLMDLQRLVVKLNDGDDPTICECGNSKGAASKRCRSCSARIASEARKTGTAA